MKKELMIIVLFSFLIVISACTQVKEASPEVVELAQCLTENGVKEYGSYTCSVCNKQKEMFGTAFEYVDYVECHPRGTNSQTGLCLERNIERTPTWTLEENGEVVKRQEGLMSFEALAEFSGCEYNA